MDTFAVSLASGTTIKTLHIKHALKIAIFFGFFQALMLLVGWFSGLAISIYVQNYSVWLAFGLLFVIGCKMLYESTLLKVEKDRTTSGFFIILGLAFATSIDALSVGISFSLLNYRIILPVFILGFVTFFASLIGIYIGDRFGSLFERKMIALGGLILILIAVLNVIGLL